MEHVRSVTLLHQQPRVDHSVVYRCMHYVSMGCYEIVDSLLVHALPQHGVL